MGQATATTQIGDGGPTLLIEVSTTSAKEEDVTALTEILKFDDLTDSVAAVASAMTGALRRAKPDEAEVTFGIDATVETGKLTSMLVKGGGKATFTVRLLWKADGPTPGD
jgi:hypothetical protein